MTTKYPASAANPKDVRAAIHAADPQIDGNSTGGSGHATGVGPMVKSTRAVLDVMVGVANDAVEQQQSGGSGHSNAK